MTGPSQGQAKPLFRACDTDSSAATAWQNSTGATPEPCAAVMGMDLGDS